MENCVREWDVISNDPNGLEVTDEQLRATNRLNEGQQKQMTEDELMLLGEEDAFDEPERMDAEMEEELLGSASVVGTCTQKATLMANSDEKNGKNERKVKSMLGTKNDANLKRFQFNLYGAPSAGPIQFGGGMDLSLISNRSSDASKSNGTTGGSRSDERAKGKKSETVGTKKTLPKRILKRKVQNPTPKNPTADASRNLGGRNAAIRLKKRRSKSWDSSLRGKWETSSSFLDLTSSTDFSSFFDEPKNPADAQKGASSSSKPTPSAKFSFFSSTERMMAEWVKRKGNGSGGAKFEEGKHGQSGDESYDGGGEEGSADEQQQVDGGRNWQNHWQSDTGGADSDQDEDETHFLGLLNHRETPKSKYVAAKHRTATDDGSRLLSWTESEPSPKSYEAAASTYFTEFSPKTTLFVCPVPPSLDENGLKCYFHSFGEVRSVVVPHNPFTGEHRGFGFVDFASEQSAKAAYAKRGLIWPRGGLKPFNLTWYRPKRPFSPPSSDSEIYVFGLSQKCTEYAIFSYFGRYGSIERAQIGRTTDGGRAALIRFADVRSASLAIEENPKQCEWAKTVAETQEQDGTPPMKKWVNVFDLTKSEGNSPPFCARRSTNASPTVHKQFFPDPQQKQKGRSHSLGRFLAREENDYNRTTDEGHFEDGENENARQLGKTSAKNRAKVSIGAKRPLSGASSEDDSEALPTQKHGPRDGRTFRRVIDANTKHCDSVQLVAAPTAAQEHRSRSHKQKTGWNSIGGKGSAATFLATPSPSLPSSSSSLALESSFSSINCEEIRHKSANQSSSVSALHNKYALFNEFLAFLEWKEKSKKKSA